MIFLTVSGGIGNQMFQYAYAHYLSKKYGENIVLNTSEMGKNELEVRNLSLQHLNLGIDVKQRLPLQRVISFNFQILRKLRIRFWKSKGLRDEKLWKKICRSGIYYCPDIFGYYPFVPTNKKIKYVEGPFQAYKYVSESPELVELLKVCTEPSRENYQVLDMIQNSNAVCMHIRRGDYAAFPNLNVCNEQYYKLAVEKVVVNVREPKFFVFSNTHADLKWIREHYSFLNQYDVYYVDLNNPDYEDLRLMYSCKHFIISNSTFSWWAQYLAENESKIVIAPEIWYKGKENSTNIYLPNWIKIPVE